MRATTSKKIDKKRKVVVTQVKPDRWGGSRLKDISMSMSSPRKSHGKLSSESPSKRQKQSHFNVDSAFAATEEIRAHEFPEFYDQQSNTKTQPDYLQEFSDNHRKSFIEAVLSRAAPRDNRRCQVCKVEASPWRCLDCLGEPSYCKGCCMEAHTRDPFHRVARWKDTHYSPDWLWGTGLCIHLGHHGQPCPNPASQLQDGNDDVFSGVQQPGDIHDHMHFRDFLYNAEPLGNTLNGHTVVTIVHTNGVHHLPVILCGCPGKQGKVLDDYLELGLFPASFETVRTVFTFAVLDDNLLSYLECHTTSSQYFQKLRRLTNPAFPHTVKNRYVELHRVKQQWQNMKERMEFGFGHKEEEPKEGELAHFCAGCPQSGVNLPPNWKDDPERWKYHRSYCGDACFSQVHQAPKTPEKDVWLKSGEGFMTERKEYAKHLATATERKDPSTCNEHKALTDRSKIHKGCDVTGICSVACMRHGAFVPTAQVDTQKGERYAQRVNLCGPPLNQGIRQANMDYATTKAWSYGETSDAPYLLWGYDVNCQYRPHHKERVEGSEHLSFPEGLEDKIYYAIGTWHVHGHKAECYPRYATTFIKGSGVRSAEILESRWSQLNPAASSLRYMTLAHRAEMLDALMNDINWKTMVKLTGDIVESFVDALDSRDDACSEFDKLDSTCSKDQRANWLAQEKEAHANRLQDVKAMDIYSSALEKAPALIEIEVLQMNKELEEGNVGLTTWLVTGIEIQQEQIRLEVAEQKHRSPTPKQVVQISRMREKLVQKFDKLMSSAEQLFPDIDFDELEYEEAVVSNAIVQSPVPLPSQVKGELPSALKQAAAVELELRIGEANDALQGVRTQIGYKSYIFRKQIRAWKGKKRRTRGYDNIERSNEELNIQRKLYDSALEALKKLGAGEEILSKYKEIKKDDLRTITAIAEPNARGQSQGNLAWFWSLDVAGDCDGNEYLEELYRISWLRAKARKDRWEEEVSLLQSEIGWAANFFKFKADEWDRLSVASNGEGKRCYALAQKEIWSLLQAEASEQSDLVKKILSVEYPSLT